MARVQETAGQPLPASVQTYAFTLNITVDPQKPDLALSGQTNIHPVLKHLSGLRFPSHWLKDQSSLLRMTATSLLDCQFFGGVCFKSSWSSATVCRRADGGF